MNRHSKIVRTLSNYRTMQQNSVFGLERLESSHASCSQYTANSFFRWSNDSGIREMRCRIAQDYVQVRGNELHPVIFYMPEPLITLQQLSGNKSNLYGNTCFLVTTLPVGNSVVYLQCAYAMFTSYHRMS